MDERLAFGSGQSSVAGRPSLPAGHETAVATVNAIEAVPRVHPEPRDWAFLCLLIFTALVYFRPQDTITPLAILPLADAAAISGLVAMGTGRLRRGLPFLRVTPEVIGVIALGVLIILTAPFSIWFGGAINTFLEMYMKVMLIFVLMVSTLTSADRLRRFTWLIVIAMSYIAFRAVFDYARGFNLVENGRVMGAVGGMFQNPNDLALNMVTVLPLAVLHAIHSTSTWRRLLATGGAFLMIGATVVSQSRGGFLGLAAMMLVLAVQIGKKAPALIAGGALALFLALPLVPPSYWNRISSITNADLDDSGSREARRILFGEAWEAFLTHPITGLGAGNFKAYKPRERNEPWQEAHNALLQVASELGLFGIAIFLFLVYQAAAGPYQARKLLRRATGGGRRSRWGLQAASVESAVVTPQEAAFLDALGAAMTAAVAGWFISALFASVAYSWTFYYVLAICVAPREILSDRLAERSAEIKRLTRERLSNTPVVVARA